MDLFNTLVKPILLYGSDYWGCLKPPANNPIENLYMSFCKQLLGVHKTTTNVGVLLELGLAPIKLNAQKASIKNWERIKDSKANMLLTSSYKNSVSESLTWTSTIENALEKAGMGDKFIGESIPTKTVHNEFYKRNKDIFNQDAFSAIQNDTSKLRTYALFKEENEMEKYLSIKNIKHRTSLTRFRLSNHKLMIEKGRHGNLKPHERLCQVCKDCIEDETHFLITCPLYETLRKPVLDYCNSVKSNFQFYTDKEKLYFIMTSETLLGDVAKFVHDGFQKRDEYLVQQSLTPSSI